MNTSQISTLLKDQLQDYSGSEVIDLICSGLDINTLHKFYAHVKYELGTDTEVDNETDTDDFNNDNNYLH